MMYSVELIAVILQIIINNNHTMIDTGFKWTLIDPTKYDDVTIYTTQIEQKKYESTCMHVYCVFLTFIIYFNSFNCKLKRHIIIKFIIFHFIIMILY